MVSDQSTVDKIEESFKFNFGNQSLATGVAPVVHRFTVEALSRQSQTLWRLRDSLETAKDSLETARLSGDSERQSGDS